MELSKRQGRLWAAAVLVAVAVVLLARLSAFGIWDPWELNPADRARDLAAGSAVALDEPPLGPWLVASGFSTFGVREWAGRLPMAVAGLLTVLVAYLLLARFAGRRAGVYAALVTGTTPLFLLNSRQMMGEAPAFLAQGLVVLTAASAVFLPTSRSDASPQWRARATGLWLAGLAASVALAVLAEGALLGVVPPLLAVAAAAGLDGSLLGLKADRRRAVAGWIVTAAALVVVGLVAEAVVGDRAGYSHLLGGEPQGGEPPTFDSVLDSVFHAFAPWSAVVLLALGRMLWPVSRAEPSSADAAAPATEPRPEAAAEEEEEEEEKEEDEEREDDDEPADGGDEDEGDAQPQGGEDEDEDDAAETAERAADEAENQAEALGADAPADGEAAAIPTHEAPLRLVLVLWATFAYGALTIYLSRYGLATYGAVVALGGAVALLLRDVERTRQSWWGAGVVTILFAVLVVRDFSLYPSTPVEALALENVQVPEEAFNPKRAWAAVVGLFAVCTFLGFGLAPARGTLDLRAPYRWVRRQWGRGLGFKVWLGLGAAVLSLMLLFGLATWVLGTSLAISTLFIRVGRMLTFVPLLLPLVVAAVQAIVYGWRRLGELRLVPVLAAGLVVGAYASQGFLPALSAHFSPREIYDTYNALASKGEPLGEFRVGSRAAAYYAQGEIEELGNPAELVRFLVQPGRRWAVFPADELPDLDRRFRQKTDRHLFVPDASSARVVLATNEPLEGRDNENVIAKNVLEEVPAVDHRVGVMFDERIELVGYDLDLPRRGYVGAGQDFTVTWYWKVHEEVSGSWKIFLHVDGQGLRLNGDHVPVDGKYPVRLWDEGDVVVDRQHLSVPGNYRPGTYTFYIGFFSGSRRLEVTEGPKDNDDRARAGTLRIR